MTGYIDTDLRDCALPEVAPDGEAYLISFCAPVTLLPVAAKRVRLTAEQLAHLVALARREREG